MNHQNAIISITLTVGEKEAEITVDRSNPDQTTWTVICKECSQELGTYDRADLAVKDADSHLQHADCS
ncbi:hypothetical protein [Rothia nasimurium]|uniref:hypothetical protein n=1 Tax=Rothia nasimurium TaxID=85336 RepID=UPI001F33871C|nr:hypothetical protein [Rothia nasimurium]